MRLVAGMLVLVAAARQGTLAQLPSEVCDARLGIPATSIKHSMELNPRLVMPEGGTIYVMDVPSGIRFDVLPAPEVKLSGESPPPTLREVQVEVLHLAHPVPELVTRTYPHIVEWENVLMRRSETRMVLYSGFYRLRFTYMKPPATEGESAFLCTVYSPTFRLRRTEHWRSFHFTVGDQPNFAVNATVLPSRRLQSNRRATRPARYAGRYAR